MKLNINTGAAEIFKSGWKHQQKSDVVENNNAEYIMYKLMFLFFRVDIAVVFISINFSFRVIDFVRDEGGFGSVVKRIMLNSVKMNSNESKTTVPKFLYNIALNMAANIAPDDIAKFVLPHSFSIRFVLFFVLR